MLILILTSIVTTDGSTLQVLLSSEFGQSVFNFISPVHFVFKLRI